MRFLLIAVGRVKEPFLRQGIQEYRKRLQAYGKTEVVEVKEEPFSEPLSETTLDQILEREGQKILAKVPSRSYLVALDRAGKQVSSEALAKRFERLGVRGNSLVVLVIGGPLGLASSVLARADLVLSFSKLTFPHQLMRLIVFEQLYRAMTISACERYHK